ncbi:MAG: glycosyltransferase family 2 protein [Candidatus Sulfotelmatobacter sp.]
MTMAMSRIAVLASCFNRKATTLAGLESLFRQKKVEELKITVFLVDDASTDGTPAAVAERFPDVRLLHGNGSLWWVGAMRKAFAAAMAEGYDGYVWWNDDTELVEDALHRLVSCALQVEPQLGPAIIVGSTCDPETGKLTYGGWRRRPSWRRVDFVRVEPGKDEPVLVDIMNGNCVLIPHAVARIVGNMESKFRHRLADHDYSMRAAKAGFAIVLAPGYVGRCKGNSSAGTWRDGTIPFAARWKDLMSPRGMDPREWMLYTRRHYGALWPIYAVSPYLKTIMGLGLRTDFGKEESPKM